MGHQRPLHERWDEELLRDGRVETRVHASCQKGVILFLYVCVYRYVPRVWPDRA